MYPVINMRNLKLIDQFLRNSAYSPKTIKSYRWLLLRWAEYLRKSGMEFKDITPEMALEFLDDQGWGISLRAQALQALRGVISYHYGKAHPIFELAIKKPKPRLQKTLTEHELGKLLRAIDISKPQGVRNLAIVTLMLDTGIRSSELCRLDMRRLRLDERSFNVVVKGGYDSIKVYSEIAARCLSDWLSIRGQWAQPHVHKVFVGVGGLTPGHRLTDGGLRRIYRNMGDKAGIEGMSPHVMRRTFATLATVYGAPGVVLQKAGGWKDPKTMAIYTQAVPDRTIESYFPTERVLNNGKNSAKSHGPDDDPIDIAGFFGN